MSDLNQSTSQSSTTTTHDTNSKAAKATYKPKGKSDGGRRRRNDDTRKTAVTCDTPEMLGHVFQVHSEQRNRGQFQDTLDQLKIYVSTNYKKEIKHMRKLFTDLQTPQINKPKPPKVTRKRTTRVGVTTRG